MTVQRAEIDILDAGPDQNLAVRQTIVVQFNPTELTLTKGAQIAEIAIPGLDSPILQFVAGQNEKLSLDLFLDSTAQAGLGENNPGIEEAAQQLYQLVKIQPKTHAPPLVRFRWGNGLSFKAIAESVTRKYTLFNSRGVPLRATLSISFREYKTLQEQVKELNLQSADHTKRHVVLQGETLALIAAREYGDPAQWRLIADANSRQLTDLRRLTPGVVLRLPVSVGLPTVRGRTAP